MAPRPSLAGAVDNMARKHSHRRLYSQVEGSSMGGQAHETFAPLVSMQKQPGLAADAAAQQAFHEKTWVWVPDSDNGYVSSWILSETRETAECMGEDNKVRVVGKYDYCKQNPPKFDQVEDMAELTHLNEASVVHNLSQRFRHDRIYTYSGPFLVAVNPYRRLDGYYTTAAIQQYTNKRREENPPHIFAVAQQAWAQMISERESQSILVTGESGAGKTENTKKVIQFLTAIATENILPSSGSLDAVADRALARSESKSLNASPACNNGRLGQLERQILQANPILEAFGNAQTVRNNNSSRFGKFVRIEFSSSGAIAGAYIDWYLLEKSRVTSRSEQERSFHIFYELLRGAPQRLKESLLLDRDVQDYGYLSLSSNTVDGLDDNQEWKALEDAFRTVGFSDKEQLDIFRVVAAILHLGNVQVTGTDRAMITDATELSKAAQMLGLPLKEFTSALLTPRTKAGREWVTQARSRAQVVDEVAAVCKTLYEKTFGALVERINKALERPTTKSTFIGVLDIAGFEIFQRNSFEQLCINYTNEKLQQFFNHHMFVLEQEEYAREEIGWQFENFGLDLQPTIELIESAQPIGILACLDEECIMPQASDETFTEKLKQMFDTPARTRSATATQGTPASKFGCTKYNKFGFSVQHYAGKVDYTTEDWLNKNKDPLNENLTTVLAGSTDTFVSALFAEVAEAAAANGARRTTVKKGAFRTVGQRHKEQLHSLMTQLQATSPHFVRCIVPNSHKRPTLIDMPLVLDQLRCNGVLEGIRIARLGYPNRLPFTEFRHRYEVLTPGIIPQGGYIDGRKACEKMLAALKLDSSEYKVGRTKAFFKAGVLAELEERRDELLYGIFSRIQAACRRFTARRSILKILNRAAAARTIQRNARIYLELRQWPWWSLYTRVRPLLAATRHDEDLRRKEAELALAKEREQRDKEEKEKMAKLQMQAEAERKKLEDALEAESFSLNEKMAELHGALERERILTDNLASAEDDIDKLLAARQEWEQQHQALQDRHSQLSEKLKVASSRIQRLEADQSGWQEQEKKLSNVATSAGQERKALESERDKLRDEVANLRRQVAQGKEDLTTSESRLAATVSNFENKLKAANDEAREVRQKHTAVDTEARDLRQQLNGLSKASSDYEKLLQQKESDITAFKSELTALRSASKQTETELSSIRESLASAEKNALAYKNESSQATEARSKAEEEMQRLQSTLATKASEDEKRSETIHQMSKQLEDARGEAQRLQKELSDSSRLSAQQIAQMTAQLEDSVKQRDTAVKAQQDQSSRLQSALERVTELERSIAAADRRAASTEAELQSLRAKQIDADTQIVSLTNQRNDLDRQLQTSSTQLRRLEDIARSAERDRSAMEEQITKIKAVLEEETKQRTSLEHAKARADRDYASMKQRVDRHERLCAELQSELDTTTKALAESKALENKTTIEHVHTLEKAMKLQDRQLAETQAKMEDLQQLNRTLEKTKSRLTAELQDVAFNTQQNTSTSRSHEQKLTKLEQAVKKAQDSLDRERRAREVADSSATKMKAELRTVQTQLQEALQKSSHLEKTKLSLQNELNALARSPSPTLQTLGNIPASASSTNGALVNGKKQKLLDELARNNAQMSDQIDARITSLGSGQQSNGSSATRFKPSHTVGRGNSVDFGGRASQAANVQLLEIERLAGANVRRHLEEQIRVMHDMIRQSKKAGFSVEEAMTRISRDNDELQSLLKEESAARQEAGAARLQGSDALAAFHAKIKVSPDDRFAQVEDSRRALQAIERQLRNDNDNLQSQYETVSRNHQAACENLQKTESELATLQRKHSVVVTELEELRKQITSAQKSDQGVHGELSAALQREANSYREQMEAAKAKERDAYRAETEARMELAEVQRSKNEAVADREEAEARARHAEARCRELEKGVDKDTLQRQLASLTRDYKRLEGDLKAERDRQTLTDSDNDKRLESLQRSYQMQLEGSNAEYEQQRELLSKTRAEYSQLKSAHDDLQLQVENERHRTAAWKHDKVNLEENWTRAKNAFDEAVQRQTQFQAENVELLQTNRDLRLRMSELEKELSAIQKSNRKSAQPLPALPRSPVPEENHETVLSQLKLLKQENDNLRKRLDADSSGPLTGAGRNTTLQQVTNQEQRPPFWRRGFQ